MPGTSETSVMVALAELHRIESARVTEAEAAEAQRRQQEAERMRREQEERAEAEKHRLRVAEAEARLRVAEELRAAEAVQRAARMEDELRVVKAERAVLSEHLFEAEHRPPPRSGWLLGLSVGAALFGTISVGLALVRRPPPPPPPPALAQPRTVTPAIDPEFARRTEELQKRLDALLAQRVVKDPPPPPRPAAHPKPARPPANTGKLSESFDKCSSDPLACIQLR